VACWNRRKAGCHRFNRTLHATPADYESQLPARRQAFVLKMTEFDDIVDAPPAALAALLTAIETARQDIEDFDIIKLDLPSDEQEIVRYSQDILAHIQLVISDIEARLQTATDELANYAAATTANARTNAFTRAARALLSSEFVVIGFTLGSDQADEVANTTPARACSGIRQI
jgi:enamine deaminase RidA (YjgF/YER057c/UK114 family)